MKLFDKLQSRLAMLVVAAVLPLAGFSVYTALRDARLAVNTTQQGLQLSATLAASSLDGVAESARALLSAASRSADIRSGTSGQCTGYLSQLIQKFPQYADLGVINLDGTLRCSGRGSSATNLQMSDRMYFREAIARNDFAVGEYMRGRVSGLPSVGFGLPIVDELGKITGVAYAALELGGLARTLADARLPAGARMTVLDRNGVVLAAQGDEASQVGTIATNNLLRQAVGEPEAGVAEADDDFGRPRVYAFAPGVGTAGSSMVAAISMDRGQIVAPGLRALYFELGALAALAVLGAGIAWLLGGRALTRPVRSILEVADRVAGGAIHERVHLPENTTVRELVGVGEALNRMADALQQRQRDLQVELQRSQQTEAIQALVFNSMHEGLWAVDLSGKLLLNNEAAAAVLPVLAHVGPAETWAEVYGGYLPDTDQFLDTDELPLVRAMRGESGQTDLAIRNALVPRGCVLRCSYRPLTGPSGIIGALVVFSDITELRKAEMQEAQTYARLRETQRRLVDALRIGRIGNWSQDLRTGRHWWSDEVHEMFGIPRSVFDGTEQMFNERIHADDQALVRRHREQVSRGDGLFDLEYRIVLTDGTVRWVHQRGELHRDGQGVVETRAGVVQDITLRKKSEAELLLLRNAVERINDIVIIARADPASGRSHARVLYANGAIERLSGHRADSLPGQPLPLLDGPQTDPQALARVLDALAARQPVRQELLAYTTTGGQFWLEFDIVPFQDDKGLPGDWILVGRDVTGRKLAESALAESEQRYQALFELGPLPMWVFDEKSARLLAVNDAALRQYGYSREEMLQLSLPDIRPERDRERIARRVAEGFQGQAEGWTHRRKDGTEFPVDVMSNPVTYAGTRGRFAVVHDITSRVQAELNLQEYLFTLQRATDASQMVVSHQTLQGTLHEVIEQARAVIRAHQGVVSLVHGADWPNAVHAISMSDKYGEWRDKAGDPDGQGVYAVACETNRPLRLTQEQMEAHPRWTPPVAGDGRAPMRGCLAVPLINRRGENIGVLQLTDKYEGEFSLQDEYVATELAQLASIALENVVLLEEVRALNSGLEQKVDERTRELIREQARYRALTDQAPQIVWSYESGKGVTYFNRTWYDIVGGTADYWLGTRWVEVLHPEDRDTSLANWVVARQSRTVYKGERRVRDKYGRYRIMSYRGAPVYDESGQVLCWVGIDTDITESKLVESQLRESNRELEAFSYSVSHDLRSPLNTIHGFSKLLAREVKPDEGSRIPHYLERIQAATGYMGQLIEDLLSLAQVSRANLRNEPVDLSEVVHGIFDRLRQGDAQRDVTVTVQAGLIAWGDVRLMRVMLENLLGNAWKFTSQTAAARIDVGMQADGVFFVRDNGAGFDMAYADKLFGVFHRLHAAAEFPGTGIGLATVHRIVTRHHGRVWAEARPGEGATFYFVFGTSAQPVLFEGDANQAAAGNH